MENSVTFETEYLPSRQLAKKFPFISEAQCRAWIRQGVCPGFYAGRKFMVNVPALLKMLSESHS